MNSNQRIVVNTAAAYGRSLFALVCGLVAGRWTLAALGQADYGLYGVIGAMTVFVTFVNRVLACAVQRFYAVSAGAGDTTNCRRWFSLAIAVHTVLAFVLTLGGWVLGDVAIRSGWIVVAPERMHAALTAFGFTCIMAFVAMATVPFSAMYTAKQRIAEWMGYSVAVSALNAGFAGWMVTHPGVWLARYAGWMCTVESVMAVLLSFRAVKLFPECRLVPAAWMDFKRLREMVRYASWQTFGILGSLVRTQGLAVLLNRRPVFGDMRNASFSVANSVAGQTDALAGSLLTALSPAVYNAYGAGDMDLVRATARRADKFGTLLILLFAIPVILETDVLLALWLKDVPIYASGLCRLALVSLILDRLSTGEMTAVNATGRIAVYQVFVGGALLTTLPFAWGLISLGFGIYSVGWAGVILMAVCTLGRVMFAGRIVGLSVRNWFTDLLVPITVVTIFSGLSGAVPRFCLNPSVMRIVLSAAISAIILITTAWFFALNVDERMWVCTWVRGRFSGKNV